ncbi:MAG: hypothetical protein D6696_11200, partial [Acidobacteria bacterium]
PPATTLVARDLAGEIQVEGAEPPWPGGSRRQLRVRLKNASRAVWLAGERPGGVALEVRLHNAGHAARGPRPWLPLPVDLPPGGEHVFTLDLRRPPGAATLHLEPHVLGRSGFARLGGPVWQGELRP